MATPTGNINVIPPTPTTVERPTSIPLEPLFYQEEMKNPIEYNFDQLDGQKIRSKLH